MKHPLFTIVIPAYNEEKNIASCLESISLQSISKDTYEVIVVDNCSTDRTAEIAKRYHATVIEEKKKGYIKALSTGLNQVKSPLIAVTDADSLPNPHWLASLEDIYKKHPEVGYITGTMLYQPPDPFVTIVNTIMNWGARIFKIGCGFHMSFRKTAWEKIAPFPPNINFNSDAWIAFEIQKKGFKRYFIPENWIKTSARHIKGTVGLKYMTKSMLNLVGLIFLKRTFWYEFGDVRE